MVASDRNKNSKEDNDMKKRPSKSTKTKLVDNAFNFWQFVAGIVGSSVVIFGAGITILSLYFAKKSDLEDFKINNEIARAQLFSRIEYDKMQSSKDIFALEKSVSREDMYLKEELNKLSEKMDKLDENLVKLLVKQGIEPSK